MGSNTLIRPGLVILQPTALCNLNCKYCYLPDRRDPAGMSNEVLQASVSFVFDCNLSSREVQVLWHAGEPFERPSLGSERIFSV